MGERREKLNVRGAGQEVGEKKGYNYWSVLFGFETSPMLAGKKMRKRGWRIGQ